MSDTAAPTVHIVRPLPASAERVFDAWLDPAWLARFMFGPEVRDEQIVALQLDARVGGRFSFRVSRAGEQIDHVGHYEVIERPRKLVFTWGIAGVSVDQSRVILVLEARGETCELSLTHELDPAWADYAERTQAGWSHMLAKLEQALTARQSLR